MGREEKKVVGKRRRKVGNGESGQRVGGMIDKYYPLKSCEVTEKLIG